MTLPHSAEAEQSLVARLLLEPEEIAAVAATLDYEDFFVPAYREQFGAMVEAVSAGRPVDVLTLGSDIGEPIDILSLTAGHHAPLSSYVEIIKQRAYQRKMIQKGRDLIEAADDGDVTRIITVAGEAAEMASSSPHDDGMGVVDLSLHVSTPKAPLLGVLSPDGTTVLYGDGGDGKGWVVAKWASQLGGRVAILDFEGHPNEWAYRLNKFGLNNALYVNPPGTVEKWATEQAARLLRNEMIEYLIIDSAMYASNVEDPYSPASAMAFARARRRLGNMPTILLAHTTGGVDKVFGSVFWRNEARVVWRLGKDFLTRRRYIECRKANNYSWLEGKKYQVEFSEEYGILNLHEHGKPWAAQPETQGGVFGEEELEW